MRIEPRLLKGFRDFLPEAELRRKSIVSQLEGTFSGYGFVPIDTPILEYTEVLLGKGGGETDKQVYRFTDNGGRDVAMRFDLTVPFARYMALHNNELYRPFKRFHVGKVFRGENTQRGRYREFMQCDFDIVGTDTVSADFETVLLIRRSFADLGVPGVSIHLSHRGIFNRFLVERGVADKSEFILRTVDKLRKIGTDRTRSLLQEEVGSDVADSIITYITAEGDFFSVLETITALAGGANPDSDRMYRIGEMARGMGFLSDLTLDPSITRGLDYYTGVVFETFLEGIESIGSVCSGGRYNDLVALYSKEEMPGVGASIGLDRLVAALEELGTKESEPAAADVLIADFSDDLLGYYHSLAEEFRTRGLRVDVFPEAVKLGRQFAFAEKKGIPWVLICGPEEREAETVNLRFLEKRETRDGLSLEDAARLISEGVISEGPTPEEKR